MSRFAVYAVGGLLGIVVLGVFSVSLLAQTVYCHQIAARETVHAGFGVPWHVLSEVMVIKVRCTDAGPVAEIGNGGDDEFIYQTGYRKSGNGWVPVALRGTGKTGQWYRGSAHADLPATSDGVFLAYVCTEENGTWFCGCRDETCTEFYWQMQTYRAAGGGPAIGGPMPPPGGYDDISLAHPSASLPTVEECLARVHRSPWEPRPENTPYNFSTADLLVPGVQGVDADRQAFYLERFAEVNAADITGTTDELIQFFSCFWGLDDETTRARAIIESSWRQAVNGDPDCNGQRVSWGLLQIKNATPRGCAPPVHTGAYPDVFVSTGNNLNYGLAYTAACYRGDMSWIPADFASNPERRVRECFGLYFSGQWRSGSTGYLIEYERALAERAWLDPAFSGWAVANLCEDESCYTLPQD